MYTPNRSRRRLTFAAASFLGMPTLAHSQGAEVWPSRAVRLVVPYPAGGVVDVHARALAQKLAADLGQPVVVDNRPGANANVGAEAVARAAPDGYTLLVSAPFVVNNPVLEQGLRWAARDLVPIARFAASPGFLVVANDSPIRDFGDFVDRARKAAPPLRYGDAGAGSTASVSLEIIRRDARFEVLPVQYKGLPQVIPDLLNGGLDFTFLPMTLAKPQVEAGRIRALANIGHRRAAGLPDVPTVAELGAANATVLSWYGLHAPTGTPASVVARVEQLTKSATASEEVRSRFVSAGGEEAFLGRTDFAAFLESERERMQSLAKAAAR